MNDALHWGAKEPVSLLVPPAYMYGTARAGNIIIACAVLHNIMVESKYHEPLEAEIEWNIAGEIQDCEDAEGYITMDANIIRVIGCEARSRLIRESF